MSELEEKLSTILSDPNAMQQIMGFAKMLSAQQPQDPPAPAPPQNASAPMDPRVLQTLSGILSQGGTDSHQRGLLTALQPYLSRDRIQRLERAMGAARIAGAASGLLNSGLLQAFSGR